MDDAVAYQILAFQIVAFQIFLHLFILYINHTLDLEEWDKPFENIQFCQQHVKPADKQKP